MRAYFLGLTALASIIAIPALADGYVSSSSPNLTVAAVPDEHAWTGPYIGANGGYAWADDRHVTTVVSDLGTYLTSQDAADVADAGRHTLKPETFTGGIQAGFNWQDGKLVFGGEIDFNLLDAHAESSTTRGYTCCPPADFTIHSAFEMDWLITVRPRLGIAAGHTFLYATGGLALAELKAEYVFTDTFDDALGVASHSETAVGWTAGGGAEINLGGRWSVKGEYLYLQFDDVDLSRSNTVTSGAGFHAGFQHDTEDDVTFHVVRAGLNYRFGAPERATSSLK